MTTAVLSKDIVVNRNISRLVGVLFFITATSLSAFVRVPLPFTPVPITMQTFFVLMAGAVLGGGLGSLSQLGYIFTFSIFYLAGPTGGYLAGFVLAGFAAGKLLRLVNEPSLKWIVFSFVVAEIIIFIFGVSHLMFMTKASLITALKLGALPFIPGEIFKVTLAALITRRILKRSCEIF